ncbi:MAG: histidine phosphatase family protein [Bacilli bacterium]
MEDTIIYLIRHAETIDENGIRNTSEDSQMINEKEILSVQGEDQAKKLSENIELHNLDVIWSSNYTRAKATAKYIAHKNNLQYNLDERLCERKLGNIEELSKFMDNKETRDPSREQLAFPEFKTRDGESANDTNKRMNEFMSEILEKYNEKRIAVISHGGTIKFYLLSYCKVNERLNLEYKRKELTITSPCVLKMTFRKNELVNLEQMKW